MNDQHHRERLPYRLNTVVTGLLGFTRETDANLESVMAGFADALQDDGIIDETESGGIFALLTKAFRSNSRAVNVLTLLDVSGSEAAQREVERVQTMTRKRR